MTEEEYHREAIAEIHRRAKAEAKPHIDALVLIESSRPPRPMIVMTDENGLIIPQAFFDDAN